MNPQRAQGQQHRGDESVLLREHPHWIVLTVPVSLFVVVCAGVVAGVVTISKIPLPIMVLFLAALFLAALNLAWRYLQRRFTSLMLTNMRLKWSKGVIIRRSQEFQLMRLNDTTCEQGILGRILGFGTVIIETGGEQSEKVFSPYPRPQKIQDQIEDAIAAISTSSS